MRSLGKTLIFSAIGVCISILGILAAAELLLRFTPYYQGLRAQPVNAQNPIFRFEPNRTVTLSKDWDFKLVNRVHVNNVGFVNDLDYDAGQNTPLLAIIGDSYIEAAITPYAETVQGRLAERVERADGSTVSLLPAPGYRSTSPGRSMPGTPTRQTCSCSISWATTSTSPYIIANIAPATGASLRRRTAARPCV